MSDVFLHQTLLHIETRSVEPRATDSSSLDPQFALGIPCLLLLSVGTTHDWPPRLLSFWLGWEAGSKPHFSYLNDKCLIHGASSQIRSRIEKVSEYSQTMFSYLTIKQTSDYLPGLKLGAVLLSQLLL